MLIRKSKNDQLARGRRLNLTPQTTRMLELWLERMRSPTEEQLLKGIIRAKKITGSLDSGQINRIYKRLAKCAGLGKELT